MASDAAAALLGFGSSSQPLDDDDDDDDGEDTPARTLNCLKYHTRSTST